MMPLDRAEIHRALELLHEPGAVFEVCNVKSGSQHGFYDDVASAVRDVCTLDGQRNVYVRLNPSKRELLARSKNMLSSYLEGSGTSKGDVDRRRWILIDCDPVRATKFKPTEFQATDGEKQHAFRMGNDIREFLSGKGFPDPVVADSGNGMHLLYRVDFAHADGAEPLVVRFLQKLGEQFDVPEVKVDRKVYEGNRLTKMYGTLSCKKQTPDRPRRRSCLITVPGAICVVSQAQLELIAGKDAQPTRRPITSREDVAAFLARHGLGADGPRPFTPVDGGQAEKWVLDECPISVRSDDPHEVDGAAVVIQFESGGAHFMCQHNRCTGKNWHDLKALFGEGDALRTRPDFIVTQDLAKTRQSALELLRGTNDAATSHLYAANGRVSEIWQADDLEPAIRPVAQVRLKGIISERAHVLRHDKNGNLQQTMPPDAVVQDLLALPPSALGLPLLDGIVRVPTLNSDGSICSTPGYDARSRRFYVPCWKDFLEVDPLPTRALTQMARDMILDEVLCDFPFKDEASKAHALAAMLSIVARPLIAGPVPLFLISAPNANAGKSLLASCIATIATGQSQTPRRVSSNEEEMAKSLYAELIKGPPVLVWDNVRSDYFKSQALEAALTAYPTYSDRVLGVSESKTVLNLVTHIMTGNALRLGPDMRRRSAPINLDTKAENAAGRTFKHASLLNFIQEANNAAGLYWALLMLVNAWQAAGKPLGSDLLGSFEVWSQIMGGILRTADVPGFLANCAASGDEDESHEDSVLRAFVKEVWHPKFKTDQVTSSQLLGILPAEGDVRGLLQGGGTATDLGKLIGGKLRGRTFDNLRVRKATEKNGSSQWQLEDLAAKGAA